MNSKKEPAAVERSKAAPVHEQVEKGTIAATRRSPLPDPQELWTPPTGYVPLDKDSILGLSKIAAAQEAELLAAVQQVVKSHPTFRSRFGELAPDTSRVGELKVRYDEALAGYNNALKQVAYFGDIVQVAGHDLLQVVGMVDESVRPIAGRNAEIAAEFEAVLKITDQRGAAVREGRARARADKKPNAADGEAPPKGNGNTP